MWRLRGLSLDEYCCVCLAPSTMVWRTHFSAVLSHLLWTPRLVGLVNVTNRCAGNLPPLFICFPLLIALSHSFDLFFFLPFSFSDLWSISDLFPLNNLSFLAWYMCVCVCPWTQNVSVVNEPEPEKGNASSTTSRCEYMVMCAVFELGVDRLSAPILSILPIIDIGHFKNRFADNFIFLFFLCKQTYYLQVTLFIGE